MAFLASALLIGLIPHVLSQPPAPTLVWPANNENINDNTPFMDWNPATGADNYDLQIDNDSDYSSPEVNVTDILTDNYQVTTELAEGLYYWHVRGENAGGLGPWSDNWVFRVDITAPPAPALLNPENNHTTADNTPTFVWTEPEIPENYTLVIDNDADFGSPVQTITDITNNIYTLTTELSDGVYYWRVREIDQAGNAGPWAENFKLTIEVTSPSITKNWNAESISGYMRKGDYFYPPTTESKYLGSYEEYVGQYYYTSGTYYYLVDNYTPLEWDIYPAENTHLEAVKTNDSDTTYIYTSTENEIDLFELDNIAADREIAYIRIYAYTRRPGGTSGTFYLALQTYGTNYFSGSKSVGFSYASSYNNWSKNPYTNEDWTKAEVDNLKVGIKSGATDNEIRCTYIYVYVCWRLYNQYRGFLSFDTSDIPEYATIENVKLYLAMRYDSSSTDFDVYFYSGENQWTGTSDLAWGDCSYNQGIFFNTSGKTKDTYYSQTVAQNAINKTGRTQFRLTSAREESSIRPTGSEYVRFYKYSDEAFKPYLEITYSLPGEPPNKPTNPSPENGATGVGLSPTLSVTVTDPDGDNENVKFVSYDGFFDGFEDNTISPFTTGGDYDWETYSTPALGNYSAGAPDALEDSQSSWIQLDNIVEEASSISFYWKVSSEQNYDWLRFYLDGTKRAEISGDVDWTKKSYSFEPGSHTFKWEYSKDSSLSPGEDKGWIDNIEVKAEPTIGWDNNVENGATASCVWDNLSCGCKTYKWYVVASDNWGWETASDIWNFTTRPCLYPSKPALYLPTDGSMLNDNTPYFEWTKGENADNHRLLVDNDSDFSSPKENRVFTTENAYTPAEENYFPDDNYSWKVVAISEDGENSSDVWTFVVVTVAPSAPTLVSPENKHTTADNTPTFVWTKPENFPENYTLVIDNDADFGSPVQTITDITDNTYTLTTELSDGAYHWRVRGVNVAGSGVWSDNWSFIIDTVSAYTYAATCDNVKGTVENFDNQKQEGGGCSTLHEMAVGDGGGENENLFFDNFESDMGNWENVTYDTPGRDWQRNQGSTPSSGTGPSGDHTTGTGYYVYTETSSPVSSGDVFILEGPEIDADKYNVTIDFWYHMYLGTNTDTTLSLDVYSGGSWENDVWVQTGNQGDTWFNQQADLSSYSGTIKPRFRVVVGSTGTIYQNDVALDDILITGELAATYTMEIYENIENVPSGENYYLEIRYKLDNTNDNFRVQVWNGTSWENRGDNLTETNWTFWSYQLLDNEFTGDGDDVQIRFVDVDNESTSPNAILKDYLRVRFKLTVDTSTPGAPVSLAAFPSGWTSTNSFTVSWTNPSDLSGIAGAYYKLDSAPTSPTDGTYVAGVGLTSISGISVSSDGSHPVYVWLKDRAGNVDHANRNSTTLHLDTTAPGITLSPTLATEMTVTGSSIGISGTVSDLTSVTVKVNGAVVSAVGGSFSHTVSLSVGLNTITITAVDAVGNASSTSLSVIGTEAGAPAPPPASPTGQVAVMAIVGAALGIAFFVIVLIKER